MKHTASDKKRSTPTVEPVIISRAQRATAAQIARERAQSIWRQRAARILVQAVIAAVALRVLAIAVQPCLAGYRSARDIRALRAQLHQEELCHQHLLSQAAFLKSDHGVEEEARRFGWTRVGEVSLQFVTPEPPAHPGDGRAPGHGDPAASPFATSATHAASSAATPSRISVSERIRLAVTRWLEQGKKR